jgi:hypothetical protein
MNKNIFKIINWIVTVIAVHLWIKSIIKTSSYGFSIPFFIGQFIGAFIVPGVFWLVYYLVYRKGSNSAQTDHSEKTSFDISKQKSTTEDLIKNEVYTEDEGKDKIDFTVEKNKIEQLFKAGVFTKDEVDAKLILIDKKEEESERAAILKEKQIKDLIEKAQKKEELEKIKENLLFLGKKGLITKEEYYKKISDLDNKANEVAFITITDPIKDQTIRYQEGRLYESWNLFWGDHSVIPIMFEDVNTALHIYKGGRSGLFFHTERRKYKSKEDCIISLYNVWH